MPFRVVARDRRGILTTGDLLVCAIPEEARFRGCVAFRPSAMSSHALLSYNSDGDTPC
jgi:hypothetical protein